MTKKKQVAEVFSGAALDALIGATRTPAELEALFRQMKKQTVERMPRAELSPHLGYPPGEAKPVGQSRGVEEILCMAHLARQPELRPLEGSEGRSRRAARHRLRSDRMVVRLTVGCCGDLP